MPTKPNADKKLHFSDNFTKDEAQNPELKGWFNSINDVVVNNIFVKDYEIVTGRLNTETHKPS